MVYRDLSLSLAGHAALIAALLAFSATNQPARIAEVVRPVRLVTTLELPRRAASPAPARAARAVEPAPAAQAAPRPAERTPHRGAEAAPLRTHPTPVKTVAPIAIPKIVIPTGETGPATRPLAQRPAEFEPALRDRLARRLSAPPGGRRTETEAVAPKLASLPQPEAVAPPAAPPTAHPLATTAAGGTTVAGASAPPVGSVQPIGFFPHAWYLAVLKERIFARWAPPSEFYVGSRNVSALVSFRIDRAGRISGATVKESSGHARFDRSALAAVQGLAQLPALPEQYAEETLDVVIRFQNE